MVFDHAVKSGGKIYRAGEEVPALSSSNTTVKEKIVAPSKEEKKTYTKSEIQQMNVATLKELATKEGIDVEDKSGTELKKLLIEHFGL